MPADSSSPPNPYDMEERIRTEIGVWFASLGRDDGESLAFATMAETLESVWRYLAEYGIEWLGDLLPTPLEKRR